MNKVAVSTLPMEDLTVDIIRVSTADRIHVDIMDGKFVDHETIWADDLARMKTNLVKDVHLMIEEPEKHVAAFIDAGADIINFHIEAAKDAPALIDKIHKLGAKAGVAINPETDLSEIKDCLKADQIMIMTVHPGLGGQDFIEDMLARIELVREMDEDIDIEVDGGIDEHTGEMCVQKGANVLCSGSYIFSFEEPKVGIDVLRNV